MADNNSSLPTSHYSLITGATRGLGRATSVQMAKDGAHIIALARTQGALSELDDEIKKETGRSASLLPFDLASPADAFALLGQTLYERFGKLDTLILNAATIGPLSPLPHVQEKDWQKVMDVNLTANLRFLRVLDPLLHAAKNPRIVFVTCSREAIGDAFWGPYAASKKALEQLATSYAEEMKSAGYIVEIHNPGPMPTRLRRDAFPGEDQGKLPAIRPISSTPLHITV